MELLLEVDDKNVLNLSLLSCIGLMESGEGSVGACCNLPVVSGEGKELSIGSHNTADDVGSTSLDIKILPSRFFWPVRGLMSLMRSGDLVRRLYLNCIEKLDSLWDFMVGVFVSGTNNGAADGTILLLVMGEVE